MSLVLTEVEGLVLVVLTGFIPRVAEHLLFH